MTPSVDDAKFLKTLTLLYVEDDPTLAGQVEAFLRRRVGTLLTARDGAAGLEVYRAQPVHIVISDIAMPVMDGLAMVEEIRRMSPAVPIVITTAFEQTEFLLRSIDLGVEKYVVKPLKLDSLEAALLDCAHRLRAEELFKRKMWLEAEALRVKHQDSLRILTGGIAHDFNNLLQAILVTIQVARLNLDPDSKAYSSLAMGDASFEQARVLAIRLSTLALGSDALDRLGPLDDLIRGAIQGSFNGTGIKATCRFSTGGTLVKHNEAGLLRVITNLAANAIEAMPSGGEFIVSTEHCTVPDQTDLRIPPGDYLHISVRDTGPGISAVDLPMVFEPYFSTKERGSQRGMGLGLALCDTIIRTHRGAITAESVQGEGATFHIYLPVAASLAEVMVQP